VRHRAPWSAASHEIFPIGRQASAQWHRPDAFLVVYLGSN
jgi:hypothetical protein